MTQKPPIPIDDAHVLATPKGLTIVLWGIREYGPISLGELILKIYQPNEEEVSATSTLKMGNVTRYIADSVRHLCEHGLVRLFMSKEHTEDRVQDQPVEHHVLKSSSSDLLSKHTRLKVEVTDKLAFIQEAFEVSLHELASGSGQKMRFEPSFGKPHPGNWPEVFVIMPFREDLAPVYQGIMAISRSLGLSCKRGDEFFSDESIMQEIWSALWFAKVCVVDCTGRNANVFYELGVAHAVGKQCILVAQSMDDIPFDVQHRRVIIYQNTSKGIREFKDTLTRAMHEELGLETNRLYEILDKLDNL